MLRSYPIVALLIWINSVSAQQHSFQQLSTEEGLTQSQVRCIDQDPKGYLWVGTLGGVSRFDGHEFRNFGLQDGLPDPQVNDIACTPDGTIWLAMGRGLVRSNGREMEVAPLPGTMSDARVRSLAIGTDGALLMAVDGSGVFRYSLGEIEPMPGFTSEKDNIVRVLHMDQQGRTLIGSRDGLQRCVNGTCELIQLGDTRPKSVGSLAEAKDGTLWVGTFGDGVFRISPNGEQRLFSEEQGLLQNNIRHILVDHRDRVWISTKFGLNLIEGDRLSAFTIYKGLPNDNIWCSFQDVEGNLWFGTDGAGLLKYAGDRFVTYTTLDGLCSQLVMCVVPDVMGDLWVGTYGSGICRLDGMAMITTYDGIPNNTIWCGLQDRNGRLWFGTSDGLTMLEQGIVQINAVVNELRNVRVLALHQAKDGRILCGTREGLVVLNEGGEVIGSYVDENGPGRSVRAIVETQAGDFWFATENGVASMVGYDFNRWGAEQGLADNNAFCLALDHDQRLWIGTSNGISCRTDAEFVTIRLAPDLGSNYIDLLQFDAHGALWVGTNNGLYRAMPQQLLQGDVPPEHFTRADGLRSLEFNLNSNFLDQQGRLWAGTASGLLRYDPATERTAKGPTPPPVYVTGLRSYLQPSEWKGQSDGLDAATGLPIALTVAQQRNYLTFDYSGISLSTPRKVRYRYMLEGLDEDWLPVTDARFASYSNIPHGDHRFLVKATAGTDGWSAPAVFPFSVAAPFYLKWWFFALSILLVASLAYLLHYWRELIRQRKEHTRQLLLRSRMLQLEQQALNANMNRHFVFNALNSIQYFINRQDRQAANKYLTSFAKLIRKNLDSSQDDMTSLHEEIERLELYLTLEHMRFKDKFSYTIEVEDGVDMIAAKLPAMMLQPYVENSIWHGILPSERAGNVTLVIAKHEQDRVRITINDDGIGIHKSMEAKSNGIDDRISQGIEITKGRADVLRRLGISDIRIQGPLPRADANDPEKKGTHVIIDLPNGMVLLE